MKVDVLVDGIVHTVAPTAGDLVRLEREYGITAGSMDEKTTSVEHVLFLAWTGLRRTGVVDRELTFDDFLDLADVPEDGPTMDPPPPLPPK